MMAAVGVIGTGSNTMRKIISNSFNKNATLGVQKKNAKKLRHTLATELVSYRKNKESKRTISVNKKQTV